MQHRHQYEQMCRELCYSQRHRARLADLTLQNLVLLTESHTQGHEARATMEGAYIPADSGQRVTQS